MELEKSAEDYEHEFKAEKAFKEAEEKNKQIMIEFKIALYERALSVAQQEISKSDVRTSTLQKIHRDILKYQVALTNLRAGIIC